MPTQVWLLRHAETATPNVFHGAESNIGLSEHGFASSQLMAEWLHACEPDVVVTSAMTRAIQTATPLLQRSQASHHIETELHERRVGVLGGTPFSLVEGLWVDTLNEWTAGNLAYTTPGAESYAEVQTRVVAAWDRVTATFAGKKIVIICHGIVVKILLLTLLPQWEPARWHELGKVENLAVSELVGDAAAGWQSRQLLFVPPQVQRLTEATVSANIARSTA
ncbi:hypothetical protein BH11PLA2_BH11PLA2_33740 [soil metagenome]